MAVYAKGKKFMASFGAGATRVRRTFDTAEAGVAWEQAQSAARGASKALPEALPAGPACWTLQKAFDETVRHVWRGTAGAPKACINANQALVFFGPDTLTSEITSTWILEWMEELQVESENSNATCNKKLSALRVMLTRAMEYGGLPTLPRIKRYKESEHRIRWYSDAEEETMLATAEHLGLPELRDFIIVGLDTGFRRGELLGLSVRDYHNGMLMLHAGETKNGQARSVPVRTKRVRAILAARQAAGVSKVFPTLTFRGLQTQWQSLRAILGKEEDRGFIPHVLRHTCATRLVSEGIPLTTVQAWMGHKVIQTTIRYAHMQGGQLMAAADALANRKGDGTGIIQPSAPVA